MMEAAEKTALDVRFMVPSCVPATPFDHSGAVLEADDMKAPWPTTAFSVSVNS